MPDTTPHTRPRSIALVALGAVTALLAAAFLVAGGAVLWADSTKDGQGYISTASHPFATRTAALATESLDVNLDGAADIVSSEQYGRLRLKVAPETSRRVFVGIARTRDVDVYLRGVAHATVNDLHYHPFRVDYRAHGGAERAAPPGRRHIWSASAQGKGPQTLSWHVQDGAWSIVVMNADGSPGVRAGISAGAKLPFLAAVGRGSLGGGLLLLAGGAVLIIVGTRPRRRRPGGTDQVGAPAVA